MPNMITRINPERDFILFQIPVSENSTNHKNIPYSLNVLSKYSIDYF